MRGGGGEGREGHPINHNFVVVVPIIMRFGTGFKLDAFHTMAKKVCDVTTFT